MSVKLNPPAPGSPRRTSQETQAPSNPLARLGQGLQGIGQQVDKHVDRLAETFEAELAGRPSIAGAKPWEGITLTGKPLQIPLDKLLDVDLGHVRKILERVVPQKIRDDEARQLIGQTQDFRETLSKVRSLATELELVPPTHPRHNEVKAGVACAE